MPHLQSVAELGDKRSRWIARGPVGVTVEWDAELVADEPGRLIAWRSIEGGDVDNAGSVRFAPAPGDRGTEVKVRLSYAPPAGRLGDVVATIFGRGADRQIREDLRRFKQRMGGARGRGGGSTGGARVEPLTCARCAGTGRATSGSSRSPIPGSSIRATRSCA